MIDIEQYKKILDSGLLLDHFKLLCDIRDGREIIKSKRVQGFLNLLNKKGYIEEGVLTDLAMELIDNQFISVDSVCTTTTTTRREDTFDFAGWVIGLHQRCQAKLKQLTGGKQVRDKIEGKSYPFLPNATDFGKVLYKVITQYRLEDLGAIERCIMNYIDKCYKAGKWFPILQYYIMKNNQSTMVTDLESKDEDNNQHSAAITIV